MDMAISNPKINSLLSMNLYVNQASTICQANYVSLSHVYYANCAFICTYFKSKLCRTRLLMVGARLRKSIQTDTNNNKNWQRGNIFALGVSLI